MKYFEADLCAIDPDNYWIDRETKERVNALTGERSLSTPEQRGEKLTSQ